MSFQVLETEGSAPIKHWTDGVPFEDSAKDQLKKLATLPFIHSHLAVMADVHGGIGVECRKDKDVLDETPACYKSIDAVMKAQEDLVDIVHTLKQVLCIKG